jgi:hypothetical protein
MRNSEYVLLFFVSLLVFYTVLSLLGPFIPLPSLSGTLVSGGLSGGSSLGCSGNIKLSFFPDVVDVQSRASALVSGISNCNDKVVFIREKVGDDLVLKCSCDVATGNGCGCSFPVDYATCSSPQFYAQVDMDGNGDYNGAGETVVTNMNLNGCSIV